MRKRLLLITLSAALCTVAVWGQTDDGPDMTAGTTRARIETRLGNIVVRLYDATPIHRDNFVRLAREGFYDGTLFHRVIKNFMIQGGDPSSKDAPAGQPLGDGGPDYTLEAEIRQGLYHKRGALAAAREGDEANPERRSSGSQFYIVWGRTFSPRQLEYLSDKLKDKVPDGEGLSQRQREVYATLGGSPHLDGQYTVFGEVEEGLDVVERIQQAATGPDDRPVEDIAMRIYILEDNKADERQ